MTHRETLASIQRVGRLIGEVIALLGLFTIILVGALVIVGTWLFQWG